MNTGVYYIDRMIYLQDEAHHIHKLGLRFISKKDANDL